MGPTPRKNIYKMDMIQRRAARYTCNRWHNISSVTEMVSHLGWEPLAARRRNTRLCMMYKIAHTVVGDPWAEWLTTTKRVTRGFHSCLEVYSDLQSTQHRVSPCILTPLSNFSDCALTLCTCNKLLYSVDCITYELCFSYFSALNCMYFLYKKSIHFFP